MTINDTDETTQCAAFSSETAFLRQTAAQIEDGRALADEADDAEGGIRGSMQLMALMAQQSMAYLKASLMLSEALAQRLTETEEHLDDLAQANTEPEMSLDERFARSVAILQKVLPDGAWPTSAEDDD